MRITLLQYSGQPNKIFKGDNFTDDSIKIINGDLVNSLDYHNPILRVKISDFIPTYYNYCVIGELEFETFGDNEIRVPRGNCYYIDNYTYLNEEICDLSLSLDVLYTYCIYINYNLDIILSRHESLFDMKLEDNLLPTNSLMNTYTYYGVNLNLQVPTLKDNMVCTITTVNANTSEGSELDLYGISSNRTFYCDGYTLFDISTRVIGFNFEDLFRGLFQKDQEYITSMCILFMKKDILELTSSGINSLPLGNINLPFSRGLLYGIKNNKIEFYGGKIYLYGGSEYNRKNKNSLNFYELPPYSNYELYVPFYGYIPLDINSFSYDTTHLQIKYCVDVSNGDSIIFIDEFTYNETDTIEVFVRTNLIINANIGIHIPIGNSNASDIGKNLALTALKVGVSIVTKNAKMSLMKENMEYGVDEMTKSEYDYEDYKISSRQGIANTIINGIGSLNGSANSGSANGNFNKISMSVVPHIKCYQPTVLKYKNYNKTVGRPSIFNGTINDLPFGEYGVCSSIYANKGYPTYSFPKLNDLNSILSILKTGFYK